LLNLYDLLGDGIDATRVLAWARGEPVDGLPRLSSAEASVLAGSWDFWARPGQKWTPGREFITDFEAGRGFGKSRVGSESIGAAATDPERWGGAAYVGGVDPLQVMNFCLTAPESGLFAVIERNAKAGIGPGLRRLNLNNRVMTFEAPRGGGGGGLTVYWGASSDPKSVRGPNYGLAWLDEYGVWYHRKTDEQGTNLWGALIPAMRAGKSPRIIITQTPSRAPEVRALQRNAERPECKTCRAVHMAKHGRYLGDPGSEPWRLPSSPQVKLHTLLDTRSTVVTRECPQCNAEVVATTRIVFGSTMDNPMIAADSRTRASERIASGTAADRQEFSPRGEVDSGTRGTLIQDENIRRIPLDIALGIADRWAAALATLGAEEVIVFVDPAVTTGEHADDSGVGVACMRHTEEEGSDFLRDQVVGLQDWSVRPDEVEAGAPSSVWGPRAYWLALFWGARRIIVETNNGGAEVLSLIQGLIARPPTEKAIAERLATETGRPAQSLGAAARRMASAARELKAESFNRRGSKSARWGWYGETAERGEQALADLHWTGGPRAWSTVVAQLVNFEPSQDAGRAARAEKKDRADWLIAAAQVLLGVRETAGGEVQDKRADSWLGKV
jgi:phage terminase large subunit-like protein